MSARETDIDRLTTLIGRCLGRIDEQAYRLQRGSLDDLDDGSADVLEEEAATLQELVAGLLRDEEAETADANRIVERVLGAFVQELAVPLVVRQRLLPGLPPAACPTPLLTFALQRALVLAADGLSPGDELAIATRSDGGNVVLEIESRGADCVSIDERAETLCDFVGDLGGLCRVECSGGDLCLWIELPGAVDVDQS